MNRLQIRNAVRNILRDDGYPTDSINEAINRVLSMVNTSGRYQCQEDTTTITLATDDYKYDVTSTILAEHLVVFQVGVTADQKILKKGPALVDGFADGAFLTTADAPVTYFRWNDEWMFDPIPNSTANDKVVTIYHYKDITELTGDFESPTIPTRYHDTLIVYGTLAEIAPALQMSTGDGKFTAQFAFEKAMNNFKLQEKWIPLKSPNLIKDSRWTGLEAFGHVGRIR